MFPELSPEEVLAAVQARWDLSGPVPVPIGDWLACPVCRAVDPQVRHFRFHRRESAIPWRCDVSVKCTSCSAVWTHGVAVTEEMYTRRDTPAGRDIPWREARDLLRKERHGTA